MGYLERWWDPLSYTFSPFSWDFSLTRELSPLLLKPPKRGKIIIKKPKLQIGESLPGYLLDPTGRIQKGLLVTLS